MTKKIYFSILLSFFFLNLKAQWTNDTLQNTLVRDSSGTSETTPLSATLVTAKHTFHGLNHTTEIISCACNCWMQMEINCGQRKDW